MPFIKFAEKDELRAFEYLLIRTPLTTYRGGIYQVPPITLEKLKERGFRFEIVPPPADEEESHVGPGHAEVAL